MKFVYYQEAASPHKQETESKKQEDKKLEDAKAQNTISNDEEAQQIIKSKIDQFQTTLEKTLKDREEAFNKKLEDMKKGKAKK